MLDARLKSSSATIKLKPNDCLISSGWFIILSSLQSCYYFPYIKFHFFLIIEIKLKINEFQLKNFQCLDGFEIIFDYWIPIWHNIRHLHYNCHTNKFTCSFRDSQLVDKPAKKFIKWHPNHNSLLRHRQVKTFQWYVEDWMAIQQTNHLVEAEIHAKKFFMSEIQTKAQKWDQITKLL